MLDHTLTPALEPMAASEKSFYAVVGRRIAERRKALGRTQVQLAETLGVAHQTMAHYGRGVSRIPVETLAQAAAALGGSVEQIRPQAAVPASAARHRSCSSSWNSCRRYPSPSSGWSAKCSSRCSRKPDAEK